MNNELEYIIKSHACTQVNFDEASQRDYPKMIAKIEAYISKHYIKKEDVLEVFDNYEYDDEDYIITPHIINLQEKLNLGDSNG